MAEVKYYQRDWRSGIETLTCDCGAQLTITAPAGPDADAAATAQGWRHGYPPRCPACLAARAALRGPIPCPDTGEDCRETGERVRCDRHFCEAEQRRKFQPHRRPDHRRPPMPPQFDTKKDPGWCRWCARPIWLDEHRRRVNARRRWHDRCLGQYFLLTRPDVQRDAVFERDQGRCYICGNVAGTIYRKPYGNTPLIRIDGTFRAEYCEIEWVQDWQVEHKIPLWKVAHLPDAERIKYFLLDNLGTACTRPCHERKTAEENAERAKLERVRVRQGLLKPKLSKQKRRAAALERWRNMP